MALDASKAKNYIRSKLERGFEQAAKAAESEAKSTCPVATGRLQNSIKSEVEATGDGVEMVVAATVDYAKYVEFGTSKMNAHPFMRPAFYHLKQNIQKSCRGS